jgi:chromosome segregation ATPase
MTFLLIVLSSFFSVLISVLLTLRLSKKNQQFDEAKIIQTIENIKEDFKEFIENEKTEIKDTIIDFDLRLRQAKSTTETLEELIANNQQYIKKLQEQNEFTNQISEKIFTISQQAELLNKEIEVLDKGFDKIQAIHDLIKNLDARAKSLETYIESKENQITESLNNIINKIIEEARLKTREFIEKENLALKELFDKSKEISRQIDEEKYQIDLLDEKIHNINQNIDEKFSLESVKIEEKFIELMRMYQERFKNMEVGLHQIKETAVQSLKEEITRIRNEIDNFNLQTISKRDEIINETRRMANSIVEQIELFQEKYLNAENRLMDVINKGKQEIQTKSEELLEQWEYHAKANLEELKMNVSGIKEEIEQVKAEKIEGLDLMFKNLYDKYQTKFSIYVSEEEKKILNVKREYEIILDKFIELGEQLKRNLLYTLENLKGELSEFAQQEKEELLNAREGFLRLREEIESKIDLVEEQIRETTRTRQKLEEIAEKAIKEIKEKEEELVHSLVKRASKFMEEQDEKLGKLNQTIDEKISRQLTILVDKGQLQIEELEKRTSATIKKSMENMQKDLTQIRNEIANIRADIISETEKVRNLKDEIFRELQEDSHKIRKFEEKLSLVDTAEEFIIKFDQGLEILTKRLKEIQENKKDLEEFLQKIASINSIKEKIEQELRMLNERRALLDTVENRFSSLSDKIQEVEVKLVNIESADKIAERIEQRLLKFEEYRKAFEDFFKELTERRKYIENALRAIEKSRKEALEAGENAKELMQKLELFEIRKDNIQEELEALEKKVAELKDIDIKFKEIEARFEQIDVLMTDLEKKQSQISVMSKRLSEISDKGGYIKNELESLVSEAIEKMDKLSAFYETVEKMLQEADRATKDSKEIPEKKRQILDEWKKEGILTLYLKHKWDPELIAERLNIDISLVRAVISTANQNI